MAKIKATDPLPCFQIPEQLTKAVESLKKYTDCFPWYYLNYGEKCYATAVVEAIVAEEGAEYPEPGTELVRDSLRGDGWYGANGTEMLIERDIMQSERQDGVWMCKFIAAAHAAFAEPYLG